MMWANPNEYYPYKRYRTNSKIKIERFYARQNQPIEKLANETKNAAMTKLNDLMGEYGYLKGVDSTAWMSQQGFLVEQLFEHHKLDKKGKKFRRTYRGLVMRQDDDLENPPHKVFFVS